MTRRSHGRIQLQVLDFLYRCDESARIHGDRAGFVTIVDIAGDGASRSRVESFQRATKSLADEGLVVLGGLASARSAARTQRVS
jgi:hypothetical protein